MPEQPSPLPLDYFRPNPKRGRLLIDPEFRRWQTIRFCYRIALFLLIAPIVVPAFSNYMVFGKRLRWTPADFVPIAQAQCVPTVRAIKQYQHDTGHFPDDIDSLTPKYLASIPPGQNLMNGQFIQLQRDTAYHTIVYDFTPGSEGWSVRGRFANGPIPLTKVTIPPSFDGSASQP